MHVRARFAPSPTGFLHIGGVGTALFSWLYAKKNHGEFVLRIEDTNVERSRPEYVDAILEAMQWLGFQFDEPYFQSKRMAHYGCASGRISSFPRDGSGSIHKYANDSHEPSMEYYYSQE